jgi:PrtD family type I secretion system ABC transporter
MISFLFPAADTAPPLKRAMARCRSHLLAVAGFSAMLNLLSLTPTIYMMQVYDRVLGSGSVATLVALSAICLFGIGTMMALDWLRARLLVRVTARFDRELSGDALRALLSQPGLSRLERAEGMRRFDTLRQGLGGQAIVALFDLPWAPLFLLVSFLIHPAIGGLSLFGCVLLLGLAWANERGTHARTTVANEAASLAYGNQGYISSYANEIRAMGMRDAMVARHLRDRAAVTELQVGASLTASGYSSLIRFLRMVLQSAALGLGALLAVRGSISPGAVFAAGLLFSRSVAPIESVVGGWKSIGDMRDAYSTIRELLATDAGGERTRLPDPTGQLSVENLTVLTPQHDRIALSGITFQVEAGEQIGVVGLSGAGKSTLLRTLSGALYPKMGVIRFDGAGYPDWDVNQIARAIGYLPQEFVLFPGTVKENISRFDADLGPSDVIDEQAVGAAKDAGVHDMILRLPQGYETRIGFGGVGLSAGQTQRIALARALYGRPKILIFDEPNAHLDKDAQYLFIQMLSEMRRRGVTVIMAAHSPEILATVDRLLVLENGRIVRFGTVNPAPSRNRALKEA